MSDVYNQYQFDDLREKGEDLYALAKYAIIRKALAGQGALNILNAGCGSGELSFLLARDGHSVHGIDPSPEYIALATGQGVSNRVSFAISSIEDFQSAELFDAVVATDVLEHIKDDRAALAKLARLARPGGKIIITVPALPALFGFHDEMLGHCRRYTRRTLKELLASAGLNLEQARYFAFSLIPLALLYGKILRRAYPVAAAGKKPFLKKILKLLLSIEEKVNLPFGTSLVAVARKD